MTLHQCINAAIEHQRSGRNAQAAELWREVVKVEPNNPRILRLFGEAEIACGRSEQGADLLGRAIAIDPTLPIYNTLGHTLLALKRTNEAIGVFSAATQHNPSDFLAFSNLGSALMLAGRADEAVVSLQRATELKPDDMASWSALILALTSCGKIEQAAAAARRALEIDPQSVPALQSLSSLLMTSGDLDAAETIARQAHSLAPDHPISNINLGSVLHSRGKHHDAIPFAQKSISLRPDLTEVHLLMGNLRCDLGEVDAAMEHYLRATEVAPENPVVGSAPLLALHFRSFEAGAAAQAHRDWAAAHASSVQRFTSYGNDRDPARALRIGFVSPDLREHPVGRFLLPLLRHHDRSACEIHCYTDSMKRDELAAALRQFSDHWHETNGRTDDQLVQQIRDDRIDILIDLAGHISSARLLMLARKPAPIEATYLGYPDTTGLKEIDWRITDAIADPIGQTESLHTERLMRLPIAWCYEAPNNAPSVARPPAAANEYITFGSFNRFSKVSQTTLELWSKVMSSVPNSRLIIKSTALDQPPIQQRIHRRMREVGIDPARVELLGQVESSSAHLKLYERIDIALDTFPYHGTTTTCEAMWMGVPVVMLAGAVHVSRVGASLLTAAGFPEWIAQSEEQYASIACELAGDFEKLALLRSSLRQRLAVSALCDGSAFARNFEAAMRQMWKDWLA